MKSFLTRDMGTDINNRGVFDRRAKVYDKVRPHYPEQLFSTLIIKGSLPYHARLLEIGPGSGQATISLARKGYNIVAIELGANLAKLAKNDYQDSRTFQ